MTSPFNLWIQPCKILFSEKLSLSQNYVTSEGAVSYNVYNINSSPSLSSTFFMPIYILSNYQKCPVLLKYSSCLPSLGTQVRRKILTSLDCIDLVQDLPPHLRLEYIDPAKMEKMISACEQPSERGVASLCDVRLLHHYLTLNLNSLQGSSAVGQRPLVMQVSKRI